MGFPPSFGTLRAVEVAIFVYETKNQEFKVSMRSNKFVDVSAVASYFGGGGHVRAAAVPCRALFTMC